MDAGHTEDPRQTWEDEGCKSPVFPQTCLVSVPEEDMVFVILVRSSVCSLTDSEMLSLSLKAVDYKNIPERLA